MDAETLGRHPWPMGEVVPLPVASSVLRDARGEGRTMRVTWHAEADVMVLSTWRGGDCVATVRLTPADSAALVAAVAAALGERATAPAAAPAADPA